MKVTLLERIVKNYDEELGKVYDLYWLDSKYYLRFQHDRGMLGDVMKPLNYKLIVNNIVISIL